MEGKMNKALDKFESGIEKNSSGYRPPQKKNKSVSNLFSQKAERPKT
jgi:hypothetical protein